MDFESYIDKDWRKKELPLKDVIKKYPGVSPYIILKTDVQRRGLVYTDEAKALVDPALHQLSVKTMFSEKNSSEPVSLLLNDGTSIISSFTSSVLSKRDPYIVDAVDGRPFLTDQGEALAEVSYWEKPLYYGKVTSTGRYMEEIVSARPQRLDVNPNGHCHFWDTPGNGCKYCTIGSTNKQNQDSPERLDVREIVEVVKEALKEPGRYVAFNMSAGTILSGEKLLDDELSMYMEILNAVGELFRDKKYPSQITATAFDREQLERLKEGTELSIFTTDIEVLDEDLFRWICPGKAEYIGYQEWKKRIFEAGEIFGKGCVNAGIVSGVEMAQPRGYTDETEAVKRALESAEEFAEHGVFMKHDVWHVAPGTIFFKQTSPSLDYYIALTGGFDKIARRYDLLTYRDGYRWCGNHPNTDLARI